MLPPRKASSTRTSEPSGAITSSTGGSFLVSNELIVGFAWGYSPSHIIPRSLTNAMPG